MAVSLRRVLPLIAVAVLIVFEHRVSNPSCKVIPGPGNEEEHVDDGGDQPEDLKVMMVANLLLLGSEASYMNTFFRDYHLSEFFRKSFEILKPDMLLVLGDISARGSELTRIQWSSVLQQFNDMLGPFIDRPFHVLLGDRDIGDCKGLNSRSVHWISSSFPGLDSSGCGAFEIRNTSFVSLNSVALLCGNNGVRFGVEKVVERESSEFQMDNRLEKEAMNEFGWRENGMLSGSGPVLLLHFPLHHSEYSFKSSKSSRQREVVGTGPYDMSCALPPNATEYIFQALRPRIIFSAHAHEFCFRAHSDGTHEISVPAMSWDSGSDPGFVLATFRRNKRAVTITHCSLAREFNVLIAYISLLFFLISTMIVANTSHLKNSENEQ